MGVIHIELRPGWNIV